MPWADIAAVVTASGKGIRFGKPKADAVFEGISFLDRVRDTIARAGIDNIIAASYLDTDDMLATLKRSLLDNADLENRAIMVFPVDFPFVKPDTVASLCREYQSHPGLVLKPSYRGKPGHPVILPAGFDLSAPDNNNGLRGIIKASQCDVRLLEVDDPGILMNINTLHDLEAAYEYR